MKLDIWFKNAPTPTSIEVDSLDSSGRWLTLGRDGDMVGWLNPDEVVAILPADPETAAE